jgi:hypothetical protein
MAEHHHRSSQLRAKLIGQLREAAGKPLLELPPATCSSVHNYIRLAVPQSRLGQQLTCLRSLIVGDIDVKPSALFTKIEPEWT